MFRGVLRTARVFIATLTILTTEAAVGICSLPPPPSAPVRPVIDHYFGVSITDPYRYMENLSDPEVQAWMHTQNDYTRGVLDRITGRTKLLARIKVLEESEPAEISDVRRLPTGRIFYLKRQPTEEVAKLYMRDGFAGEEKLIADPNLPIQIPGDFVAQGTVLPTLAHENYPSWVAIVKPDSESKPCYNNKFSGLRRRR